MLFQQRTDAAGEGIVVFRLVRIYRRLKRNVLARIESVAVEKKQCQQAAQPSVAVLERVYAEEVVNEYRNCDQRFQFIVTDYTIKLVAYAFECGRCFERIEGSE